MSREDQFFGLSSDEIEVECILRNIKGDHENALSLLRAAIQEESIDHSFIPTKTHAVDKELELKACSEQTKKFSKLLDLQTVRDDISKLNGIRNRIEHWRNRTLRLRGEFHQDNEVDMVLNSWRRTKCLVKKLIDDLKPVNPLNLLNAVNPIEHPSSVLNEKPSGSNIFPNVVEVRKDYTTSDQQEKNHNRDSQTTTDITHEQMIALIKNPTFQQLLTEIRQEQNTSNVDKNNLYDRPNEFSSTRIHNPIQETPPSPEGHPCDYRLPPPLSYYNFKYPRYDTKWNISFSGTKGSMDVLDFLFRLESNARREHIPINELRNIMPRFLKESAEKWYWNFERKNPNASYEQIKAAVLSYFRNPEYDKELRKQIRARKQKSNELFHEYLLDVESLNNLLIKKFSESDLLDIVRENMDLALQNFTLTMKIHNTEDLKIICEKYEKLWARTQKNFCHLNLSENRSKRNPTINEIEQTESLSLDYSDNSSIANDQYPALEAFANIRKKPIGQNQVNLKTENKSVYENIVCWNCKIPGHRYQECSIQLNRIICFGCGRENVIKPNCSFCQSRSQGNAQTVVMSSGPVRPKSITNSPKTLKDPFTQESKTQQK